MVEPRYLGCDKSHEALKTLNQSIEMNRFSESDHAHVRVHSMLKPSFGFDSFFESSLYRRKAEDGMRCLLRDAIVCHSSRDSFDKLGLLTFFKTEAIT